VIDRDLNHGRSQVRRFLRRLAPFGPMLDIGAGGGQDLALAREASPAAELHGVEIDPAFGRALAAQGVRVHAVDIEREQLHFPDGRFDVVLANQVLEHAKELFWIAHEVSRVLKVGGHFVIGVPNLASLHNRLLLAAGLQPTPIQNNSAHVRGFTKGDLRRFFDSAFPGGYELRGFGGGNFYPFPPLIARPLARLFPSLAWGIFLCLRKTREYGREFLDYPLAQGLQTNFFLGPGAAEKRWTVKGR
jgi:SAM-dependent methyltransferase